MNTKAFYKISFLALYSLIFFNFFSCQGTRGLAENEKLYTGAKINIDDAHISKKEKKELKKGIEDNLTPKPNASLLGMRPRVAIHNMISEPEKPKGFWYWLKYKVGEKPVLLSDVNREFNRDIIVNYSENKGYFNTKAKFDTLTKGKKAEIVYNVNPDYRYFIRNVHFPSDSTLVEKAIAETHAETLLKSGDAFDLDVIKNERERIDNELIQKGFYFFHPDNIIVQADSTVTDLHEVELILKVKDDAPQLSRQAFTIDQTVVFTDYDLDEAQRNNYGIPANLDGLEMYNDKFFIDPNNKFNPKIFDNTLPFKRGDLYSRKDHNIALNRLISLGVFKFVKNQFIISDSLNHKFDAYYLLTPKKFKSLRLETLGKTNSDNFVGGEVNLNWSHLNLFRGAEHFTASIFSAFDYQLGGPENSNNLFRYGTRMSLVVPRLWVPFFKPQPGGSFLPKTQITTGYEFQKRTKLYTLGNYNFSFGYYWKENLKKEHEFNPFVASYVSASNVTENYRRQIEKNPYLQRVIENQLIFGPNYSFTFTNTMLPQKNTFYYQGKVDLSGNLSGLITGANAKKDKQVKFFNVAFSQYAKIENDFRFFHKISSHSSIASRLIAGVAYPYGNSIEIPFSKQFFAGGSSSIRAFRARTLGPGSFDSRNNPNTFFYDQTGDIKLELNTEFRFPVYKFVHAALFADAGNVWLVNKNTERPGGEFTKNFIKEIAVGAGVGLRLDFSVLVLRLDLATPVRKPYLEEGKRWMFDKINFNDKNWRKDNLILNIAIGYPF